MSFETDFDSAFSILLGKAAGLITPTGVPDPGSTGGGSTTTTGTGAVSAGIEYVIDGGGTTITTGVAGGLIIPFPCALTKVQLQEFNGTNGSISIDIKKSPAGNSPSFVSIAASTLPAILFGRFYSDDILSGWTKTFARGDALQFSVGAVTLFTRITVMLYVTRTDVTA